MQPPIVRKKNAAMHNLMTAAAQDDDGDDELDEMPNMTPPKSLPVDADAGQKAAPPQGLMPGLIPPPGEPLNEEQRQLLREYRREVRDTRVDRFLNDPEGTIKIFFSGYYRDRSMARYVHRQPLTLFVC